MPGTGEMPDADRGKLLRPQDVAARVARLIEDAERIESGSRLALAELP